MGSIPIAPTTQFQRLSVSQNVRVYDALVAGHICLDIIPSFNSDVRIEPGKLVEAGPATISTGGAVSNTGQALAKLGLNVSLIGKVGDDLFGKSIQQILGNLAAGMTVAAGESTSYTIVINLSGKDRTFLHAPGCNDTFVASYVPDEALANTRLLHFGYPTLMARMHAEEGQELVDLLRRAKDQGVTTSLDMSLPDSNSSAGRADWRTILERALPYTDIFAPNIQELQFMVDLSSYTRGDEPNVESLARQCLALGANVVAVKAGDKGLHLYSAEEFRHPGRALPAEWQGASLVQSILPVKVAGTTGAGDATVAGLLAGLLGGQTPAEATLLAVAVGAFCCEQPDATTGLPTMAEVRNRLATEWRNG